MTVKNIPGIDLLSASLKAACATFLICLSSVVFAEEAAEVEGAMETEEAMEAEAEGTMESEEAVAAAVAAESMAAASSGKYVCTHNNLVRRIEVSYQAAPAVVPCEVLYTKESEEPGVTKSLWQAANKEGYCEEQAKGFSEKLQGWGWSCTQQ